MCRVVGSWEEQFSLHVHPGVLKVHAYVGNDRNSDVSFLSRQDVVIVSYNTLAAEHSKRVGADGNAKRRKDSSGILDVRWRRIVLDEAHTIRNRTTKQYQAVMDLQGDIRWALSGTPIMNRADDCQPLWAFLRASPLDDWSVWQRAIGRPLQYGDIQGLDRLRVLMKSISLRRTNGSAAAKNG